MTIEKTAVPIRHDDRFFIGGAWVEPPPPMTST